MLSLKFDFLKVSGCGNDFVVIVDFEDRYNFDWKNLARIVCRRAFSIGADGLVLLNKSEVADARMRIFNPDGSEAEMCGNAARCAARVIVWKEIVSSNTVTLQTLSGIITAQIKENIVKLKMSKPHSFTDKVQIKIKKKTYTGSFINTGVPHTVFFEEDIETINLAEIGPKVRYDQQFQPEGTNVNFVQITGNNSLSIRTYERGVEAETYACGTGAVASAVIGHLKGSLNEKIITVTTKGGELTVEIDREDREIENVYLASEASIIYSGQYLGEIENG